MAKHLLIGMTILVITFGAYATMPDALAHRDGCHRWHSCPSDTGSYTCGDTGYCSQCPDNNYCKAGQPISFSSYSSNSGTSNSATTQSTTVTSHPTATQSTTTASSPTPTTPTPVPSTPVPLPTATPSKIPSWVKSIFSYYAQGNISDDELISAIQFLVKQGILKLS